MFRHGTRSSQQREMHTGHPYSLITKPVSYDNMAPAGSNEKVCGSGATIKSNERDPRTQTTTASTEPRRVPIPNSLGYGNHHKNYYLYTGQSWAHSAAGKAANEPMLYANMRRPYENKIGDETYARFENCGPQNFRRVRGANPHPTLTPTPPPSIPNGYFDQTRQEPIAPTQATQGHDQFAAPVPTAQPAPAPAPAQAPTQLRAPSSARGPAPAAQPFHTRGAKTERPASARFASEQPRWQQRQQQQQQHQQQRTGFHPWIGQAAPPPITFQDRGGPYLYNTHLPRKQQGWSQPPRRPQSAIFRY